MPSSSFRICSKVREYLDPKKFTCKCHRSCHSTVRFWPVDLVGLERKMRLIFSASSRKRCIAGSLTLKISIKCIEKLPQIHTHTLGTEAKPQEASHLNLQGPPLPALLTALTQRALTHPLSPLLQIPDTQCFCNYRLQEASPAMANGKKKRLYMKICKYYH